MKTNDDAETRLKRTIELIKAENETLKAIIDKTPASVIITDPLGNIEFVNPFFCDHTGYTLAEVIGKNPRVLQSGYQSRRTYEDLWKTISSGNVWEGELCNRKKNGDIYWEQASIAPVKNEKGETTHYIAIKFDVTASKESTLELETAKKFNDVLIDSANVMIIAIDNQGRVKLFNKAAERISGYSGAEVIGRNWFDRLIPECIARDSNKTIRELIINREIPSTYENGLTTKCGTEKIISWQNTTLIDNNAELTHISFGIDITEQKKFAKELADSEARFKKLIQNSGDVFAIVDKDLKIRFISNSVEKMTGFTVAESLGASIFDVVHHDDIPMIKELIARGITVKNYAETIEYRRKRKDGSFINVESIVQNLYHDEHVKGVLINSRDITERKQYENKLKELNATKDKLFSIIAHDLRGPIGNSALLLEMLAGGQVEFEPEEKSTLLKEHARALKNTGRLLENLLDWARSQKNDVRIEKKNIDLNRLTIECFDILKAQAREKNISLIYDGIPETPVFADERMIKTVIRNLLSNAIKFSHENGTVKVSAASRCREVSLTVTDDGVGMNEEKIEKLFKITDNISTKGTRGETGTGLGLLLCLEFVTKNGGRISVKSAPGKGSAFTIVFPAVRAFEKIPETAASPLRQRPKHDRPLEILVAEDDVSTQHLLEKIFKIKGWNARFADNGLEAVKLYGTGTADIILMDINMPVMNGLCAMNEIRKIESESGFRTPIIAFTTFNSREEIENFLRWGFDDYAPKPLLVNVLYEKIEANVCKKSQLLEQPASAPIRSD